MRISQDEIGDDVFDTNDRVCMEGTAYSSKTLPEGPFFRKGTVLMVDKPRKWLTIQWDDGATEVWSYVFQGVIRHLGREE